MNYRSVLCLVSLTYAGPEPLRPVHESINVSATSSQNPTAENSRFVSAASPLLVAVPHENTDAPLRTKHGVLGMIRIALVLRGSI